MISTLPDGSRSLIVNSGSARIAITVVAAAVAVTLTSCDSGSSLERSPSRNGIHAQAIDGYIVNANVTCDGAASDPTGAAGFLACPEGSELIAIEGGQDVGFDRTATDGGEPFDGVLEAPGTLQFVTPLTTLAVKLAIDAEGKFDPTALDNAISDLQVSFGLADDFDINVDPTAEENLNVAQLNAQIHQIVKTFAAATEDYGVVVAAFAESLRDAARSGKRYDIGSAAGDVMRAINTRLASGDRPSLAKDDANLGDEIEIVERINEDIAKASDLGKTVEVLRATSVRNAYISLDRQLLEVALTHGSVAYLHTLDAFENDNRGPDDAFSVKFSDALDRIELDSGYLGSGYDVQQGGDDIRVGLGFMVESLDDGRELALTTRGARVSMDKGDPASIVIEVPDDTVLNAQASVPSSDAPIRLDDEDEMVATDATTTIKHASWTKRGASVFANREGLIDVDIRKLNKKLSEQGIDGFLDRVGHYRVTMVLDGIRIGVHGTDGSLDTHTVKAGQQAVTGLGLQGYISYTR